MQAVRLFFIAQLRVFNAYFTPAELEFALAQPHVKRNLFMYFGFALDDATWNL